MKIIITDAWIGTQMSQKSIPGKHDTSISHRRTQETTARRIKTAIHHRRVWKRGLWGSEECGPHSPSRPDCPLLAQTHTFRGDWGVVGGEWGEGWLLGALWVDCRAGSRLCELVGGPKQASSHGYSLKAYSSASFYQTPRLSFCTSPLCEAWGRTAPRGLGSLNPGALSCSEPWFISDRGQDRETEGKKEKEGG